MMLKLTRKIVEPEFGNLRQHHALTRNTVPKHHVKHADAVRRDNEESRLAAGERHIIEITHLALTFIRKG